MPIFGLPSIFEEGYKTLHDEPKQALGSCYVSNTDDTALVYVRFSEDVEEGDSVQMKSTLYTKTNLSPQTDGGSVYAPAGSQKITEHDATYLTDLAGLPPEPTLRDYAYIHITSGTGVGQEGYITNYTDKVLNIHWYDTDDGTLKTALDETSDYIIWAPWYQKKANANSASAAQAPVNGVVLARRAKKDQYGLIGVEGDFRVKVQEAVLAGDVLIPVVTLANAGENHKADAADVPNAFATVQVHANPLADETVLARSTVYAEKISIVEEIAESQIRSFDRPAAA